MPNDTAMFLGQFLKAPTTIGALAPSSRRLATAVCTPVPERGEPTVVELGPGTGAFTVEIQRRLSGRGHHLAVEVNEVLAGLLAERFEAVVPGRTVWRNAPPAFVFHARRPRP
jgi:phospholipid N-methyltransferase